MTAATLRAELATRLDSLLGTYTTPGGNTFDALYVGEPPSDWVASGLEVRIEKAPDITNLAEYERSSVDTSLLVRIIPRQSGDAETAVRRILRKYTNASVTRVAGSERLGILTTYQLTIPA